MDTPILLPPEFKARVEQVAKARKLSVSDVVRESLELFLAQNQPEDPLFADTAVFCDEAPADLAAEHDKYLYGDAS
jgi:hypothetical protein